MRVVAGRLEDAFTLLRVTGTGKGPTVLVDVRTAARSARIGVLAAARSIAPRRGTRPWCAALLVGFLAATTVPGAASADPIRDAQWYISAMHLSDVHTISRGARVTVAVIDSGVDAEHSDLVGSVLKGADANLNGDGWTDGGDHGTGVASLVAGHGHEGGGGVLGIAPEAKILPIGRSTSALDRGMPSARIPAAIDYAVQHGAKVITLAFGGVAFGELEAAIQRAQAADVVIVAGTGNVGDPGTEGIGGINYPAKYPGVLAVTATGRDGTLDPISVTGTGVVLAAPGADLNVASSTGGYRHTSGTSLATGVTAGAVAVLRAKFPQLSARDTIALLTSTATDRGAPGRDAQYGFGSLDLLAALRKGPPATTPTGPAFIPAPAAPPAGSSNAPTFVLVGIAVVLAAWGVLVVLIVRRRRRPIPPGPPTGPPPDVLHRPN
ncbi:S8 family serine peptidase [Longispora sp. NPDC051575]|uniref:S8 family peptidase n=1 Tax=Longispora sp. NPDC051575 TaxID=3154943 RepID=UPI00342BCAEF